MPKPKQTSPSPEALTAAPALGALVEQVRTLVQSARRSAIANINSLQVLTNYEIGRLIVEHEQQGQQRAAYGKELLSRLATDLTAEFGRGFSKTNLEYMRKFYRLWPDWSGRIPQKPSEESMPSHASVQLSWSHYVLLISIRDDRERRFYEIEAMQNAWSIPELKRQVGSALYERLALSRDKEKVRELAEIGHAISQPSDVIKDPYILEFLGLEESPAYSERDLESAIISKLEHFLLELGKGFLFEARQKRFTFDEDHFYVDLVFYNRLLRCYVLIDLKLEKLTHQDLGQMQMYVNYFDRFVKTPEENPSIGIVLCKRKNDALVELTLPEDANIFAAAYQLYLPSKEDLKQRLMEWTAEDAPAE
jgi:predicted nuclease of restriction endonuclease-like (RecB) superfamily